MITLFVTIMIIRVIFIIVMKKCCLTTNRVAKIFARLIIIFLKLEQIDVYNHGIDIFNFLICP